MQTVLIIDDDAVFRAAVAGWFLQHHWEVVEAEDGETGLSLARQHLPRIVICDLLMPRANGYQVCRALRARPDFKQTRIVVTSTSSYATDRKNALEAGADEYLVKPVRPEDLARLAESSESARASAHAAPTDTELAAKEPTRLKFWGVRGSIATPGPGTVHYGGNTSCVEVRSGGEIIILDAGTGLRPLGMALMREFKDAPMHLTVLITHTHWDHIQGFPFFVPAYNPRNKIRILGYEGARKGLENTLSAQMESPYFPISMQQMPGNISIQELRDLKFNIGAVRVQAAFLNHPGICTGYRLNTTSGSVAYLPDIEPYHRFNALHGGEGAGDPHAINHARAQEQKLIEFVRNSDVMIIDAQYDPAEYERHVGWGHSSVDDSVDLAVQAKVGQLFLFHHDPEHDDAKISQMVDAARDRVAKAGATVAVDAAREGVEVALGSPKRVRDDGRK